METTVEVSELLTELLAWSDEDRPEVFLSASLAKHASSATLASVIKTVVLALDHERTMRRIARQADVDPETMLNLLLMQFEQVSARSERDPFSEPERTALAGAGIDLSGLPATAEDPAELTASRFATMFSEALTVTAAAALLEVTSGRIRQRIAEGTLYGLRAPRGSQWRLPRWQFSSAGALYGLEVVLPALPTYLHPLTVCQFMTTTSVDLAINDEPISPVQWLSSGGDPRPVADLAMLLPAAT